MDSPAGRMARTGLETLYGKEPILIRTSGGSVPISPFVETLGVPAAKVPLFVLSVPVDIVLLPFAAIGGFFS